MITSRCGLTIMALAIMVDQPPLDLNLLSEKRKRDR
jgi:hypothetical protein